MVNTPVIRHLMLLTLSMTALAGCTAAPSPVASPMPVAEVNYRYAYHAALDSLKAHGFLLDRQDYRFGRISTKPRVSPNLLEVWNRDNTTAGQSLSASLNNEHRIATILLDRAASADGAAPTTAYQLTVEVTLERTTDPDRRLTGSASPRSIVRPLAETPQQFERQGVHGTAMVTVGRDEHFEQRLLADIAARLAAAPLAVAPQE